MKDKPKIKLTMEEHASSFKNNRNGKTTRGEDLDIQKELPAQRILREKQEKEEAFIKERMKEEQLLFEKQDKLITEYNTTGIYNVLEDYKTFVPYQREVIIRCFAIQMPVQNGVFLNNQSYVAVPSRGYQGVNIEMRTADWQFEPRGIVVSVNKLHKDEFVFGDVIQIDKNCVVPFMKDKDSPQQLRYGFWLTHHWSGIYPPAMIENENYGYFKIPLDLIEGFVSKKK